MFTRARRWRVKRRHIIDERTILTIKFIFLRFIIGGLFLILVAQLWRMQVVESYRYQLKAENNRLRILPIPAKRGVIYDRSGALLVRNVPSFTVGILLADLPVEEQESVSFKLSRLLDMPEEAILRQIKERRSQQQLFAPTPIKTGVDQEKALIIEERREELPGVTILIEPTRHYLEGGTLAHLLGYVGRISPEEYKQLGDTGYELNDRIGKTGVEFTWEEVLRGKPGREQVVVDVKGRKLETLQTQPPEAGKNLVLSLDLDLQKKMTEFLAEGMKESRFAVAATMNPQTGEILGLVSLPSYDDNLFSGQIPEEKLSALLNDPRRPLLNHAIASMFPPGSIFKIVTGSAALEEGVATPRTQIVSTGLISIPDQYNPTVSHKFYDWAPLGQLDFYQAIARSSDVYFYYLAGGFQDFRGLGQERLAKYAREFGLGSRTNIDLLGETEGLVPDSRWKKLRWKEDWYTGDTYNMGIGQGFLLASPLQMLNAVSVVANGGTLLQPRVVREIVDSQGKVVVSFNKRIIRKVGVSPRNLAVVAEGMRQAVAWGTATLAQVPGIEVAGKTGTAEFGETDPRTGERPTHGWFIGFAPFQDPEIAIVIFLERGQGALIAAPIASKILNYYFYRQSEATGKTNGR